MSGLTYPRPSSAERWVAAGCRGSVRLEARYPETRSVAAEEGQRLHALAADVLRGGDEPANEDDAAVVGPYVADVRRVIQAAHPQAKLFVEVETWAHHLRDLRGTPDATLIDFANKRVTIWDLKTGWRLVEVLRNWQLLCYAWMHGRPGWTHDLRIVQPLPYHENGPIRSWTVTWEEIEEHAETIKQAFAEAIADDPVLRPGGHCLYCSALVDCVAARTVTLGALEMVSSQTRELPDDVLARELDVLRETTKLLKLRTEALEDYIEIKLRDGASIPGAYMKENRRGGRLKWEGDENAIRATLTMLIGKDPAVPKLPTPTQLKSQGVALDMLRPFTKYHPGKMVVSTGADETARKAFADAPNLEHTKR